MLTGFMLGGTKSMGLDSGVLSTHVSSAGRLLLSAAPAKSAIWLMVWSPAETDRVLLNDQDL